MAAMLLPSLYSALLQVQRCIAKVIAHEKLETEQLTTIRIALSELQWYEALQYILSICKEKNCSTRISCSM